VANFTVQDLLGSAAAFLIFPIVLLLPGYAAGWIFDVFGFRRRRRLTRYGIALLLSNAIVPIVAFLEIRYLSASFALVSLGACDVVAAGIDIYPILKHPVSASWHQLAQSPAAEKLAILLGGGWVIFSLLLLVDLQLDQKLYFATTSYDYTTRISIINAITRTGIPPVNPGYYPGGPERLTFLYYYWYIPASLVDQAGGAFVNSRQAMLAGTTWTGLCLMAGVALYLRLRGSSSGGNTWYQPLIGIQLLAISGLDVIPVLAIEMRARQAFGHTFLNGRIEGWNMPISSWLNAVTWVPNHVSAALQCLTALMLVLFAVPAGRRQHIASAVLAGFALASALGSSVWILLVFGISWAAFAVTRAWRIETRTVFWSMSYSSMIALVLSLPFILDLLNAGGASGGEVPIAFFIRPFVLSTIAVPPTLQPVANLLLLPLNYGLELGFFFMTGLLWMQHRARFRGLRQPYPLFEAIVLVTVVTVLSFVRSTVIAINDLGIRAWLIGQFVLLVWAADIVRLWLGKKLPTPRRILAACGTLPRIGRGIQAVLVIGLLTTGLEAFATRMWPIMVDLRIAGFPNDLSPDTNLGSRTYGARLAFDFVNRLPAPVVAQINPSTVLDRPSGLYGTFQMALSDRTAYGVADDAFQSAKRGIARIFNADLSWASIDTICRQYAIDTIIYSDLDPAWSHLSALERHRPAMYHNDYYAVFRCGGGGQP
jgi:hypothetical protein